MRYVWFIAAFAALGCRSPTKPAGGTILIRNLGQSVSAIDGKLYISEGRYVQLDSFWVREWAPPGSAICLHYDPAAINYQPLQVSVYLSSNFLWISGAIDPLKAPNWNVTFGDWPAAGADFWTRTEPQWGPVC